MVGSGVYLLPSTLGGVGSISIFGWVAATAAALAVGGMFSWLAVAAPEAKGLGGYVKAGMGQLFAVQTTVVYWSLCWFGNIAIALAAAGYLGYLIPALSSPTARLVTALVIIWINVGVCFFGPRLVAKVEGWTLALGLAPVLLAATAGWYWFSPETFAAGWNPKGLDTFAAVGQSGLTAFWAFLGVECAAAIAGVVRDPERNVPRATLLGVLVTAIVYISATTAIMGIIPASTLANSGAPFADAAQVALGVGIAALIAFSAFARTSGCALAWTMVTAETTRSGADEGAFLPAFRSRRDERASAINVVTAGVLMSLAAFGTMSKTVGEQFTILANVSVILALYAYALAGLSLIRISDNLGARKWPAVATAVLAIVFSLGLISTGKPIELLYALVPIAAGALLYLPLRQR
jgi:arginine:agmatine antiporter